MVLARSSTLPVGEILARAAAEVARHFGVVQQRVATADAEVGPPVGRHSEGL